MCWGGVTAQRSGWTPVRQTGSHTITQSQPQPHNQHAHSHSHTATASTTYALVLFKMNTQQRPLLWCESSLGQQLDGSACGTGFGSCSFVGEPRADFGGGNAHEGRQASTGRHWRVPAAHHTHTTVQCDNHICACKQTTPHAAHSRVHGKHCHQPIHLPRREPPSTTTPTTVNSTTTACAVANGWLEL